LHSSAIDYFLTVYFEFGLVDVNKVQVSLTNDINLRRKSDCQPKLCLFF